MDTIDPSVKPVRAVPARGAGASGGERPKAPPAGQDPRDCPIALTLQLVAHRWTVQIIYHLRYADGGLLRFKSLQRVLKPITQKELTKRLRELETVGLVNRRVYAEVPPRVEYRLTKLGESLVGPLEAVEDWVQQHAAQLGPTLWQLGRTRRENARRAAEGG